ncbi:hypothetical protein CDAR_72831 [Caerostris darwini]|uniref:Uncharacterized protein n=1 Tax=Caerostris darwini TaxID=1538125 RepID=A0AAV4MLP7_9ARAC|nr:hypothetical protein CDAR_72831 [Caerostris darwini]
MLQVFRRLLFCSVLGNGDYSTERKPLYQVEYKDADDADETADGESDDLNLGLTMWEAINYADLVLFIIRFVCVTFVDLRQFWYVRGFVRVGFRLKDMSQFVLLFNP